jgi:hypothetical protein
MGRGELWVPTCLITKPVAWTGPRVRTLRSGGSDRSLDGLPDVLCV